MKTILALFSTVLCLAVLPAYADDSDAIAKAQSAFSGYYIN